MADENTNPNIPIQAPPQQAMHSAMQQGQGFGPPYAPSPHHTTQYTLIVALVSAVVSALSAGGGVTWVSNASVAKQQLEIQEVRADVRRLSDKMHEIYLIVDAAHPRAVPSRQ